MHSIYLFSTINILTSLLGIIFLITCSKKLIPSDRCSHDKPVHTGGGIIFVLLFFINYLYFFKGDLFLSSYMLLMILGLAIVGIIDDFYYLSYKIRLFVQLLLSINFFLAGYKVSLPILSGSLLPFVEILLTILLIIGLINACNFFDGLDGLLSGCFLLTICSSLFLMETPLDIILLSIIPVLVFYFFNFPKAKIFMGDIGSTFLGFFLALVSLKNQIIYTLDTHTALIHKGIIYTLTPMMFAWFDVFFTLMRRIIEGRHIFTPWRDYPFHLLLELGYSHVKISLFYYTTVLFMIGLTYLCMQGYIPFLLGFSIYGTVQISYIVYLLRVHYRKFKRI